MASDTRLPSPSSKQLQLELETLEKTVHSISLTQNDHLNEAVLEEAVIIAHRIRCLLTDAFIDSSPKEDFRKLHGFEVIVGVIEKLSALHQDSHKPVSIDSTLLRLLKGIFDILADALKEHVGNRQYFSHRIEDDGWISLERCLLRFEVLDVAGRYSVENQKRFFGLLFAFATADETVVDVFREPGRPTSSHTLLPYRAVNTASRTSRTTDGTQDNASMDVLDPIRGALSAEILWHPEMLQIIFSLLQRPLSEMSDVTQPARDFILSILEATLSLVEASQYNAGRLQSTTLQKSILASLLKDNLPIVIKTALRSVLQATTKFGFKDLEDVDRLCQAACYSEEASCLLLDATRRSREPSCFHFDLSSTGYASMEFSHMKRQFPPRESGYALQLWFKVDHFDETCHTTLFGALTQDQSCFVLLYIESATHQLVLQTSVSGARPSIRFKSTTFSSGIWYHLVINHKLSQSRVSSHASLFVDGTFRETIKCSYPGSDFPAHVDRPGSSHSRSLEFATQSFIGTPQDLSPRLGRGVLNSRISVASLHLFSAILPDDLIYVYHTLGPSYLGNFQDCLGSFQTYHGSACLNFRNELEHPNTDESSLITRAIRYRAGKINPEVNIIIGVAPSMAIDDSALCKSPSAATRFWSHASLRAVKSYLRHTSAGVVLNLAVADIDKALQSSYGVGLLTGGSTWSLSYPIDDAIGRSCGCVAVSAKLVQNAVSEEAILRAVTIFIELVYKSWRNSEAMERQNGYGVLALLLERKALDSKEHSPYAIHDTLENLVRPANGSLILRLLQLILQFNGYNETRPEESFLLNPLAYSKLIMETDLWRRADEATQRLYYKQFRVFATADTKFSSFNVKRLRQMRVAKKLVDSLHEASLDEATLRFALQALQVLINRTFSADVHRSVALFVTYHLHHDSSPNHLYHNRPGLSIGVESQTVDTNGSREVPSHPKAVHGAKLAVAVLEMYTDAICLGPGDQTQINKFAKSVSNKWLLHLLVESDQRVIIAACRILAKLAFNESYMSKFDTRAHGFVILRTRLRKWWFVDQVWTVCFAMLFGQEISGADLEQPFNADNIVKSYMLDSKLLCPSVLPVLLDMLEDCLTTVVTSQFQPSSVEHAQRPQNERMSTGAQEGDSGRNNTLLESVINLFTRLICQSTTFAESLNELGFTRDLLQILNVVRKVTPSIERESLHSSLEVDNPPAMPVVVTQKGSEGEDSLSLPRTPTPGGSARLSLPWRRASSFVLVTRNDVQQLRTVVIRQPLSTPTIKRSAETPVAARKLIKLLATILRAQILYTKDFGGLGLFLKIPSGSNLERNMLAGEVIRATLDALCDGLNKNRSLFTETRCLTNISRLIRQLGEAVFEGWLMAEALSILGFIAKYLACLQSPSLSSVKNVRLCRPLIADIQQVFRRVTLLCLTPSAHDYVDEETLILNLQSWWHAWITDEADIPMLGPLCYLLYEKLLAQSDSLVVATAAHWRLLLAHGSEEISVALATHFEDDVRHIVIDLTVAVHNDLPELRTWLHAHRKVLDGIFNEVPKSEFTRFATEENAHTEQSSAARLSKRHQRLSDLQTIADENRRVSTVADEDAEHWIANICASELLRYQRAQQDLQEIRATAELSISTFTDTFDQKGLTTDHSLKWQLDEVEGQDRMRLRLIPASDMGEVVYKSKRQKSTSVSTVRNSSQPENGRNAVTRKTIMAPLEEQNQEGLDKPSLKSTEGVATLLDDDFEVVSSSAVDDLQDDKNRRVLRSLQRGEQVQDVHNVSRIKGLEPLEGLLIIGKKCVYLVDGLFQCADGEIVSNYQAPQEERDPYLQIISGNAVDIKKAGNRSFSISQKTLFWKWSELISVSKRRFLLRDVALEVFFNDGLSYLLTTATLAKRDALYLDILNRASHIKNPVASENRDDAWRIALLPNPRDESGVRSRFSNVFGSFSTIPGTEMWLKGELSNFHYLMLVNTAAGRTFNDLTQYPVFPWVIADYRSEILDFSDPRTFRDFSKPMGAQNSEREASFRERYQMFAEMTDHQEPAFHYGTHYSSAMIVTSYLIRLEPFVQSYLLLQGGSFDHADRLFSSIETAWLSASRDNMTDVRELTPEFFYLPEFLVNSNNYDFGSTQSEAIVVNDVHLPPWAKGDPAIFIKKQREALESPFVTKNLHNWINLIFGHAQRGEAAVEATNVFHHLSYQGARDLDKIEDHRERLATIGIIHNFGQTPRQLFTRPHEACSVTASIGLCSDQVLKSLIMGRSPISKSTARVSKLIYAHKKQTVFQVDPFTSFVPPENSLYIKWNNTDRSLRFINAENNKVLAVFEQLHTDSIISAQFLDSRTLLTASRDCTITIWTVEQDSGAVDLQLKASLIGHKSPVTAVAISTCLRTLASVSQNSEVIIWDVNRCEILRRFGVHDNIVDMRINNINGNIVLCTTKKMFLFTLNGRLLAEGVLSDGNDHLVTSCEVYLGSHGEWLPYDLIFTGHTRGLVKIWKLIASDEGIWTIEAVHSLRHLDRKLGDGTLSVAAITCILPTRTEVFTGDEDGRVFQWKSRSS